MPLRKYRSVEETPPVARLEPLDPDNLRVACELSEVAFGLRSWRFVPGVKKFSSVAVAAQRRSEWEKSQIRR